MKKLIWVLPQLLAVRHPGPLVRDNDASLLSVSRVHSSCIRFAKEKVGIGHQVYQSFLENSFGESGTVLYDLEKRYTRLTGTVGIPDDWKGKDAAKFKIVVDGQLVSKGTVQKGAPRRIAVDLEDAKSLDIELTRCVLASPLLSAVGEATVRQGVRLKEPEDGAEVVGALALSWSAVDDAVSYAVEVICTSLDSADEGSNSRCFVYQVRAGKTSLSIDTRNYPPGRYRWSVVAFGPTKMLGSFAPERSFVLRK